MIAPEYFENGDAAMETVCYQMDKWSLPCPGQTLQLPLLGSVLQVIYDTPNLFVINTVKTCTQEPLFSSYSVNFYMLNPITNDLEPIFV